MYRFKLSAILLSVLARLGLAEPNYSIVDESSNRWLPDDTLLTGLNTIYNSISQGLQNKDDKKRRAMSVIAAAIVEYLSSDLTEEQDKLNTASNVIARRINSKSQEENSFRYKLINEATTKTPDAVLIEDNSDLRRLDCDKPNVVKDNMILAMILDTENNKKNVVNEQYYKYDHNSLTDETDGQRDKYPQSIYDKELISLL